MKRGEPPQPSRNCAKRNSSTGPVVDGVDMMQLSALDRRLLPGERGGDERPAEKHTAKRNAVMSTTHSLAGQLHNRGNKTNTPEGVSVRDPLANCAPNQGDFIASNCSKV